MSKYKWLLVRKKRNIFGEYQIVKKRFYYNNRLKYLAWAGSLDTALIFDTKNDALDCLYNKWQKWHHLPTDIEPRRFKL